jgi:hypothetical protein
MNLMSGSWGSANHGLGVAGARLATALVSPAATRARPATALLQLGCGRRAASFGRAGLSRCLAWVAAAGRGCGVAGRGSATAWHNWPGLGRAWPQLVIGKTKYKNVECNGKTQMLCIVVVKVLRLK